MRVEPKTPSGPGTPPPDSSSPREMRSYLPGDLGPPTSGARAFAIAAAIITLAFALPLYRWATFAWNSEIHSFILLIPIVSIYLLRTRNPGAPGGSLTTDNRPLTTESRPRPLEAQRRSSVALAKEDVLRPPSSALAAGFSALLGAAALAASLQFAPFQHPGDPLTLSTAAYLLFLLAAALATVGWPYIRARLFPVAFLAFMIPLPDAAITAISVGLQYASAEASDITMRLTGMPVYREGLTFKLAGLSVFVAEECSGIRSTLVLFITSLVAGYILLKRPIHRIWIAALVFPLGVLRNALRITTICWLSVNVDLGVIDSPLHHRGGPLFFAISLVPLFVLLWWFRKRELRSKVQEKVSA